MLFNDDDDGCRETGRMNLIAGTGYQAPVLPQSDPATEAVDVPHPASRINVTEHNMIVQ